MAMDISQLNSTDRSSFQDVFGNIFEHHPAAADYCFSRRPFKDKLQVVECFSTYLEVIPTEDKLQILKNHPMLGSKTVMTTDSVKEQKSAGLNELPHSKAEILEHLNQKYCAKFGFPYIICVAEITKEDILKNMQERMDNDLATEIFRGIDEVKKIAKHRILGKIK